MKTGERLSLKRAKREKEELSFNEIAILTHMADHGGVIASTPENEKILFSLGKKGLIGWTNK